MSYYEDENGTFVLPSAEFAGFRQAMQAVQERHTSQAFDLTQEFWRGLTRKQQTDAGEYAKAQHAFMQAIRDVGGETTWDGRPRLRDPRTESWFDAKKEHHRGLAEQFSAAEQWRKKLTAAHPDWVGTRWDHGHKPDEDVLSTTDWWLERKVRPTYLHGKVVDQGTPSRVQKGEVDWPTNRSTQFQVGEAYVSFDPKKRSVTWGVENNNHAVERARATTLGSAFFDRLDKVRWTPKTGGTIYYHSEADDERDGWRNNASASFGYLGIEEAPHVHQDFTNGKGERIGCEVSYPSRVPKGFTGVVLPSGKPVKMVRDYGRHGNGWRLPTAEEKKLEAAMAKARREREAANTPAARSTNRGKTTAKSTPGSFAPQRLGSNGDIRLP